MYITSTDTYIYIYIYINGGERGEAPKGKLRAHKLTSSGSHSQQGHVCKRWAVIFAARSAPSRRRSPEIIGMCCKQRHERYMLAVFVAINRARDKIISVAPAVLTHTYTYT